MVTDRRATELIDGVHPKFTRQPRRTPPKVVWGTTNPATNAVIVSTRPRADHGAGLAASRVKPSIETSQFCRTVKSAVAFVPALARARPRADLP
jgi:hypothetical protein